MKLLLALLMAGALLFYGCLEKPDGEETGAKSDFELGCRLNGFSWITKQPQGSGIVLGDKPCLGCTVDSGSHFCVGGGEYAYNKLTAALADFRGECKANNDSWMLMEPTENNTALSERMCWGCMADGQNHFCNEEQYLIFEKWKGQL